MRHVICSAIAVATLAVGIPAAEAAEPDIQFEVRTSRVLSLYYFARAARGEPNVSGALGEIWTEHHDEKDQRALERVSAALDAGPSSVQYRARGKATGRHHSQSLVGLLEAHAGEASDLADFSRRITGLLPVAAHAEFIEGLRAIAPLHERHVWKPASAFLQRSRRELERIGKRHDVERRFEQAARFYGSEWPATVPITMYLVGVPVEADRTHGHSAGPIAVAEVVKGDNLESRFAVLFHEMCHSLYGAQPHDVQVELEQWFDDHPLALANPAYVQLNEGLATALGNGWMEHAIRGEAAFEESWYADEMIDGYARALYPVVTHYLSEGRQLDRAFVNRAVALFAWKFPGVMEDPEMMFRKSLFMMNGGFDAHALMGAFRERFTGNLWGSQPISHEKTRGHYASTGTTAVLVVHPERLGELGPYPWGSAAQKRLTELFAEQRAFVWVTALGDGRTKVFVGVPDQQTAVDAFDAIAESDRLPDGTVLTW